MGRKAIDLTGQRFGKWTVVREIEERDKHGRAMWECRCDCDELRDVPGTLLSRGQSKSCGCVRKRDLIGQSFGNWTVVSETPHRTKDRGIIWKCQCTCGEIKDVASIYLINGDSTSCGCTYVIDLIGEKFGNWTVLERRPRNKHGGSMWYCKCDCGELREVIGDSLIHRNNRSCGCLNTGENHHFYNPDLTDEERLTNRYQLNGNNIVTWRTRIYTYDNYTCQGCGKHGGILNAHHLNSWNAFPEQRFDTANGITLCEDCHKEFHHFNGYGDNTLEEFRDHIADLVGEDYIEDIAQTLSERREHSLPETRQLVTH